MIDGNAAPRSIDGERIDIGHDYAVCAWARHFNTSEKQVKEAVQAVGDQAHKVRDYLAPLRSSDRPSAQ